MAKVCKSDGQGTFAGTQGKGELAPIADIAAEVLTSCWKPREQPVGERMIVCTRQITPELLVIDHFVSEGEDGRGDCQAEFSCGFQIDYQIEL